MKINKSNSKSSKRWLNEHVNDPYVHLAKKKGYRSRAAFKLLEINDKDKILFKDMLVVDLGSAPGSWSQVLVEYIGKNGKIFALDILPMENIEGVNFILGDFILNETLNILLEKLSNQKVDLVISDIAPNISGNSIIDQNKSFMLSELVLDFAINNLKKNGTLLVKVFQGSGFDSFFKEINSYFDKTFIRKPKASRDRSNEVYILGKNFK